MMGKYAFPAVSIIFNFSSPVKGKIRAREAKFWVPLKLPRPIIHNVIIRASLGEGCRVAGNIGSPRKEKKNHYWSCWRGNRR